MISNINPSSPASIDAATVSWTERKVDTKPEENDSLHYWEYLTAMYDSNESWCVDDNEMEDETGPISQNVTVDTPFANQTTFESHLSLATMVTEDARINQNQSFPYGASQQQRHLPCSTTQIHSTLPLNTFTIVTPSDGSRRKADLSAQPTRVNVPFSGDSTAPLPVPHSMQLIRMNTAYDGIHPLHMSMSTLNQNNGYFGNEVVQQISSQQRNQNEAMSWNQHGTPDLGSRPAFQRDSNSVKRQHHTEAYSGVASIGSNANIVPVDRHTVCQSFIAVPSPAPKPEKEMIQTNTNSNRNRCNGNHESKCSLLLTPVKPLTPYNFYFQFERKRILAYCQLKDDEPPLKLPSHYRDHYMLNLHNSEHFQQQLLKEQWSRPRNVKRRHRKSHGRISFQELSKRIARSWHSLPSATRDVFREIAKKDQQRYRHEIQNYIEQQQPTAMWRFEVMNNSIA